MIKRAVKQELKIKHCGFEHEPVDAVVRSQWQSTSRNIYYLIYRWLVAIFVVAVVIIALEHHLRKYTIGTFFIYLTRCGITLNMIVGIYGAVLVTIWHFHTKYQGNLLILLTKVLEINWFISIVSYRTNSKEWEDANIIQSLLGIAQCRASFGVCDNNSILVSATWW